METQNRMNVAGIGPRLVLTALPIVLLATIFMYKDPDFLKINAMSNLVSTTVGIALIAIGVVFHIISAITMAREFKKGKLITHGTFRLCRNPIYAAFIVFLVPGIGILLKSGLILLVDFAIYLYFKVLIRDENMLLKQAFGEEYEQYAKRVNEIIPIPKFWNR